MESESEDQLSFLDILVSRSNGQFFTGVFRKRTFTDLGTNFFSYCPLSFKINAVKTLLHRAYSHSCNWIKFHEEISFLRNFFTRNCFPLGIFEKLTRKFLDNIFKPKHNIPYDVPKKQLYVCLPFTSNSQRVKQELTKILNELYPYVNFHFIFKNPFTIGSLFRFKDTLPELMRSSIVYHFSCPRCNLGTYVGCSNRLLKVRIDSHRGVSYRTGLQLSKKEFSSIRNHSHSCNHTIQYKDFKIISQSPNSYSLPFLESLFIKQLSPNLNSSTTSVPLHIA